MVKESESCGGVPEAVMDSVNTTLTNLREFRKHFQQFLPLMNPQTLSQLPPLERAHSLFLLSKITSTLLTRNHHLHLHLISLIVITILSFVNSFQLNFLVLLCFFICCSEIEV